MERNYTIKDVDELIKYLTKFGRQHPIKDKDYQLKTNKCWIHELDNDEIIVFPNKYISRTTTKPVKGIIFRNRKEFENTLEKDIFPMENIERNLYDLEVDKIKNINKEVEYYFDYLCSLYKLGKKSFDEETAYQLFSQTIGRKIKGIAGGKDKVSLMAVAGEIAREKIKGKWLLEKRYGTFNPYYVPMLLTKSNTIIDIGGDIITSLKWNNNHVKKILKYTENTGIQKRTLELASRFRDYIILE